MEIKINKEIKDYHESMFFGLSARQFVCSALAVGAAVGTYFGLRDIVGKEVVSWLCVVLAAPFAAAGFFKYNGMTFEKFAVAFIRSEFLASGKRLFESENILLKIYEAGRNECKGIHYCSPMRPKEVLRDAKKAGSNKGRKKKNS